MDTIQEQGRTVYPPEELRRQAHSAARAQDKQAKRIRWSVEIVATSRGPHPYEATRLLVAFEGRDGVSRETTVRL